MGLLEILGTRETRLGAVAMVAVKPDDDGDELVGGIVGGVVGGTTADLAALNGPQPQGFVDDPTSQRLLAAAPVRDCVARGHGSVVSTVRLRADGSVASVSVTGVMTGPQHDCVVKVVSALRFDKGYDARTVTARWNAD
jgi:hypothetical protein